MKYQSALIAALMAMGLAACSSTDMNSSSAGGTVRSDQAGTRDTAIASDRTNGSNGGGADNSMGNSAGTGNSGVSPNGR